MLKSASGYRWPARHPAPALSARDLWICGRLAMLASSCAMLMILIGSFAG